MNSEFLTREKVFLIRITTRAVRGKLTHFKLVDGVQISNMKL